jgi:hypothetical protein
MVAASLEGRLEATAGMDRTVERERVEQRPRPRFIRAAMQVTSRRYPRGPLRGTQERQAVGRGDCGSDTARQEREWRALKRDHRAT